MNDAGIYGTISAIVIAILGFWKYMASKKSAVHQVLEKQVESLQNDIVEKDKKIQDLTERLLKSRGKK